MKGHLCKDDNDYVKMGIFNASVVYCGAKNISLSRKSDVQLDACFTLIGLKL